MESAQLVISYSLRPSVIAPDRAWIPESTDVEGICSFSDCMVPDRPELRAVSHFGDGHFYDEASMVNRLEALERDSPGTYCGYAWVALPTWYGEDGPHPGLPQGAVCFGSLPLRPGYIRLGFDAVEVDKADKAACWGCSPLSCNGMAKEIPVNRYCLFDTQEAAAEVCDRFARTQCVEPGDYVVVEVWRRSALPA